MKKILVIGQGIAGVLLAWELRRRGAQVQVADAGFPDGASHIAAGIINPVTGKRYVKSWRFDEFWPAAKTAYQALEQALDVPLLHEFSIVRLLSATQEINDWSARCALPDYAGHLSEIARSNEWASLIRPGFHPAEICRAARVAFANLLPAFRKMAAAEGFLKSERLEYQDIEKLATEYDHLIFCEGWRGQANPFFAHLPWQPAKGEVLLIRIDHPDAAGIRQMLKKNILLAPLGDGLFWAGANYDWAFEDAEPTEAGKNFVLNELHAMLDRPFEIVGHLASVRPSVKDRRPFVGLNAEDERMGIFNGLGAKGALLAPFWAAHFARHLLEQAPLERAVDIRRF